MAKDPRVAFFKSRPKAVEEQVSESVGLPPPKPKEPVVFNKGWDTDPKACLGKRWAVGQDMTELLDSKGNELRQPVRRYTRVELNMLHNHMACTMPRRLGWFEGIGR